MKKIIFAIILLISVITAKAQLFYGGVDVGIIASQIDGDLKVGYKKAGLSFKAYSGLNIRKNLSLISGVGYAGKGAHSGTKEVFFNTSLHYLEVPLLLKYQPISFDKLSFTGGFILGYLIQGSYDDGAYVQYADDLNLRKTDFAGSISLNYQLGTKLIIKLVNDESIIPIKKGASILCWKNPCWHNRNVRLTFQYNIF